MKKKEKVQGKKQFMPRPLGRRVIIIIIVLALMGAMEATLGMSIFRSYREQDDEMESATIQAYLSERDQAFYFIHQELIQMMYDGVEFKRVTDALENGNREVADVVERNNAISELKNKFTKLIDLYGSNYNFFFYDNLSHTFIERGGSDYYMREKAASCMKWGAMQDELPPSSDGKWKLYKDKYIVLTVRGSMGVVGCWMEASDFTRGLYKTLHEQASKIMISSRKDDTVFSQSYSIDGRAEEAIEEGMLEGDYHVMTRANIRIQSVRDRSIMTKLRVLQYVITGGLLLYVILIVWVVNYVRKDILQELNSYYDGLLEKQKLEFDYAQLQIRPHFYINCLNVIYSMAEVNRGKEIQRVCLHVTKYLRYIFRKSMKPAPLKEEIDFVRNYLQVQKSVDGQLFSIELEIEDDVMEVAVPPLLIQTFVENSIKHCAALDKEFAVRIEAKKIEKDKKQYIYIGVGDSGNGFPEEQVEKVKKGEFFEGDERYHIGIANAVKRMNLLYGEDSWMEFGESCLGGALIEMYLPLNGVSEKDEEL